MSESTPPDQHRPTDSEGADSEHDLVAVIERRPGHESPDAAVALASRPADSAKARYWRCRCCGQERTRHTDFPDKCDGEPRQHPLHDGGYSIDDPRTRRALTEDMEVRFGACGGRYVVHSESGATYTVDVDDWICNCPDFKQRGNDLPGGCKHLRRVDLEIRVGAVPEPDGTFRR